MSAHMPRPDRFQVAMTEALGRILTRATSTPWRSGATHADETVRWVELPEGDRIVIGTVSKGLSDDAHLAAVARLVSAAPELLAALEHLMRYDFGQSEGAVEGRAAIAKARGT